MDVHTDRRPADARRGSGADVLVVGGGVIGLAIAWQAAARGLSVRLLDPAPGRGASWAAAGMLAPAGEVASTEPAHLRLRLLAADRYPAFVTGLEAAAGASVGYRRTGSLDVALDAADRAELAHAGDLVRALGLAVASMTGRQCRELEPALGTDVRSGLLFADDHQVDNRLLVQALLTAAGDAGVAIDPHRAARVTAGQPATLVTGDGERLTAPWVVVAAGCWSAGIGGLSPPPPVRPVKGHILRLRCADGAPPVERTVRAMVRGRHVYLVPRATGEVVVGATVEERGFDTSVQVGPVRDLLTDATAVVPELSEAQLVESRAGLRPGSPDNGPMVGPVGDGVIVATGHYRNGILLAPVTAEAVVALLTGGVVPPELAPFDAGRFAGKGRAAASADASAYSSPESSAGGVARAASLSSFAGVRPAPVTPGVSR